MAIVRFAGTFRFLSNFFPASILFDHIEYPTVEHAYQAAKTDNWNERAAIALVHTPGEAKRIGRTVTRRPGWEAQKIDVMRGLLRQKFAPGSYLAGKLLATGNHELVEGNSWGDRFWGVCDGTGENHLGLLLMEIRAELRSEQDAGVMV